MSAMPQSPNEPSPIDLNARIDDLGARALLYALSLVVQVASSL
jgi:hypothetical protein